MLLFFLLSAALTLCVLALLLPAMARQRQHVDAIDRQQVNVAIARAQLDDLEQKVNDGELPSQEFHEERLRIEKDLAVDLGAAPASEQSDRGGWMLWPVAATVPVLAGVMYLSVGTPDAINPANRTANAPVQSQQVSGQPGQQTPDMREVAQRIEEQLAQQPDNATGWFMLGRARMALGEFPAAVEAIRRSLQLDNSNPEVIVRLADAIAMSQGGSLAGEPENLLGVALEMQPDNQQGLWLLGIAQNERSDHSAAIATWQKLLPLLQGDQQSQQQVQQLIDGARQSMSRPAAETTAAQNGGDPAVSAGLTVNVQLKNGLGTELPADTAVFVYAKAANGPPMPLAVVRKTLADLPFTVLLSDADAMMPAMKLSAFDQVIVGARLSLSGDAIAQSGDIYGEVQDVVPGQAEQLTVEIATIKP